MIEALFWLLIAISLGMILTGLLDTRRVFEFPFFIGAAFAGFLGPQLYSLAYSDGSLGDSAIFTGMMMTVLCALCAALGYYLVSDSKCPAWAYWPVEESRLVHVGYAFAVVAFAFFLIVMNHPGRQSSQWTGAILIYNFFVDLSIPAMAILLMAWLRRPRFIVLVFLGVAMVPSVLSIIAGRRADLFAFAATVGVSLFLARNWRPPWWLLVAMGCAAVLFVYSIAAYRTLERSGELSLSNLLAIDYVGNFQETLGGDETRTVEANYAFHLMAITQEHGLYGYGRFFWNSLVWMYVPAQLVGRDVKEALTIEAEFDPFAALASERGTLLVGVTQTGVYTAFGEFGYFGALLFAVYAVGYRLFWRAAREPGNLALAAIYPVMIVHGIQTVTHHIAWGSSQFVFFAAAATLAVAYAGVRRPVRQPRAQAPRTIARRGLQHA